MGYNGNLYYGILGTTIAAPLILLIITAPVMIHYVGKTFLIGKTEKARADVSAARRLNENENSCDGDCSYSGGGCRPSQVVSVDGKKERI